MTQETAQHQEAMITEKMRAYLETEAAHAIKRAITWQHKKLTNEAGLSDVQAWDVVGDAIVTACAQTWNETDPRTVIDYRPRDGD